MSIRKQQECAEIFRVTENAMNIKYGVAIFLLLLSLNMFQSVAIAQVPGEDVMITVPTPKTKGTMSLEEAIAKRRSTREFTQTSITKEEISQLLWAAQGITDKKNSLRAAPSAGALYPLEIYLFTRDGIFHYNVEKHALEVLDRRDGRQELSAASFGQDMIQEAAASIVIGAVFGRVTSKYGDRGVGYVYMEAGHAAQNIHLMAVSLGLASVPVGAFDGKKVKAVLSLDNAIEPLYIIPVGAEKK